MTRLLVIALSGLAVSGCAFLSEAREDEVPSASEMGMGGCEPAGPHDAAAPGEWLCEGETGNDRVQPRHRIED